MRERKPTPNWMKIVGGVMLGLILWGGGFIVFLDIAWFPETRNVIIALSLFAGAILLVTAVFMYRRAWVWISAAVLLVTGGALAGAAAYEDSIRMGERMIWQDWNPKNPDSLVSRLDGEPTLRLTGAVPRMDGATALYPVYAAFAGAVCPVETLTWRELTCSTTASAYCDIVDGERDIIFCAAPSEDQLAYAREKGVELVFTPIGKEAFVFFVNAANPLEDITVDQIRGIWSGQITRWDELGVKGFGKIRPFQRSPGSGSQSTLISLMGDVPLMEPEKEDVSGDMGGIVSRTADYRNYRNAIGYSFLFYATVMNPNAGIRLLSVGGVAPTRENIENGTYPLGGTFYAVTRSDADENTLALLEWICGPQGQELVEKAGYTPYTEP